MMEKVYRKAWYLEEGERLRKHKESSSRVWEKVKYRRKETREVRLS